jgi:phosphoglycolate phosphatase
MQQYKNILFDLDGTLIDSAVGIVESFHYAYLRIYNKECIHNLIPLIGPPIDQVLTSLNGEVDPNAKNIFVDEFKKHYDIIGYKKTTLYNDVLDVLNILLEKKFKVFIATNKRMKPTILILDHLSIKKYFTEVYSLDFENIQFKNKTDLIAFILKSNTLTKSETLMIGDTIHDEIAANNNNIDFAWVEYGYGKNENSKYKFDNIKQLINIY